MKATPSTTTLPPEWRVPVYRMLQQIAEYRRRLGEKTGQ